jgi:hypothetical protein
VIFWLHPPFKREDRVTIRTYGGRVFHGAVVEIGPPGAWPIRIVVNAEPTMEGDNAQHGLGKQTFTSIGSGPDVIVAIAPRGEAFHAAA